MGKSKIHGGSLAALGVLIIFIFGATWLVLSKIDDAIEEFESINNYHIKVIKEN